MYEFDTIKRYIEMFDIDDYKSVIIISLFILLLSTRIFKAIHLSKEELIFINKKDSFLRNSFVDLFLFICLGFINAYFVQLEYLMVYGYIYILLYLLIVIIKIGICFCKKIMNYFRQKNNANIKSNNKTKGVLFDININSSYATLTIIIFGIILSDAICNRYEINIISVSVLMAVIETILMNLILFKDNNNRADFYIKENKIKWYIYKKINVNYILCGNKINRSESDKIKLIKSDPNLIFYRVPSEKQNE